MPTTRLGAADVAADADELERDLGWAIAVVSRGYRRVAASAVTDLPGGARGLHLLEVVAGGVPRTQLALSRRLGTDKSAITYLLDDLEAAKLVKRRPDPTDRRARQIVITATGTRVLARVRAEVNAAETELLSSLEPAERDILRDLLRRVAQDSHDIANPGTTSSRPDC